MTLQEIVEKIKLARDIPRDIFVILLVLLSLGVGFLLGKLESHEEYRLKTLKITQEATESPFEGEGEVRGVSTTTEQKQVQIGQFVGSKHGHTYYPPSCSFAQKIKESNKIWFLSKEDAEREGYHASATCAQ